MFNKHVLARNLTQQLPDEFNWKPYWGYSPQAVIVHSHGVKFHSLCAMCLSTFQQAATQVCSRACRGAKLSLVRDHGVAYALYYKQWLDYFMQACPAYNFGCLGGPEAVAMA